MRDIPQLNGAHFRFTVVEDDGWVNIDEDDNGNFQFSGYCVDIIRAIASRANFTFELFPPSGFGSLCNHPNDELPTEPYLPAYRGQFLCGQSDVQDPIENLYTTDFYQSMFYVTPTRQLSNRFTLPFLPPTLGGMQIFGTAIRIDDIFDVIEQQQQGKQGAVCLKDNTAAAVWMKKSFPDLVTRDVNFGETTTRELHGLMQDGTCEMLMDAYPVATRII